MADVRFGGHHLLQIVIIVSDGHIVEDRDTVRRHVTRAQKNWQLLVFVVLIQGGGKGVAWHPFFLFYFLSPIIHTHGCKSSDKSTAFITKKKYVGASSGSYFLLKNKLSLA